MTYLQSSLVKSVFCIWITKVIEIIKSLVGSSAASKFAFTHSKLCIYSVAEMTMEGNLENWGSAKYFHVFQDSVQKAGFFLKKIPNNLKYLLL